MNGFFLRLGNLVHEDVDAIVNAANAALAGGGGVDGAIHAAGGPSILEECRRIGRCETGDAVLTGGGRLKARFVIHTVGPIWNGGESNEDERLRSCYRRSMAIAREHGMESIAFPSIATGAYRFPLERAARIAVETVLEELRNPPPRRAGFVLFDERTYAAYQATLSALGWVSS